MHMHMQQHILPAAPVAPKFFSTALMARLAMHAWMDESSGTWKAPPDDITGVAVHSHVWTKILVMHARAGVQHADSARAPPEAARQHGHHLLLALPWMHCRNRPLPEPCQPVPHAVPALPKVHHQGLCVRGGGRQAPGAGQSPSHHPFVTLLSPLITIMRLTGGH